MQSTRSALRFGAPVQFRDRWQGTVAAFEVDDDWTVANIVVVQGVFRRVRVKLPFSIVTDWDEEHLALDCTSYQAFRREIPPLAVPPRSLSAKAPLSAADADLAGVLVERRSRQVTHLLLSRGLFGSDRRIVSVREIGLDAGERSGALVRGDLLIRLPARPETLPVYRADRELEETLWQALVQYPLLTGDDRRGLDVEVVDGVAHLSGNVRTPQVQERARDVAASVPGMMRVEDRVINDRQLEIEIGRALHTAGLYRHGRVYVRAHLGIVALGGFLTSDAVIPEIVRVAESVPGVRKIESHVEVRPPRPREAPAGPEMPPAPTAKLSESTGSGEG